MPDILKTENNVTVRHVDMQDGTWAKKQASALVSSNGYEAIVGSDNCLRVIGESVSLFNETFDSLDTTTRWSTAISGGGTVSMTGGTLTMGSGTTANAYAVLRTQFSFSPSGLNFLALGSVLLLPQVNIANNKRFFGWATVPATPTFAAPVTNGIGFEIDGSGNFDAVAYSAGVKIGTQSLNAVKPQNGIPFFVFIARRADRTELYINQTQKIDASFVVTPLDVFTLPATFVSVNNATGPAVSGTINSYSFGIGDYGPNSSSIKDPTNPFLQAAVVKPSTPVSATQSALAVALHPSSPSPSPAAPDTSYFVNSAATTNGALIATGTSGLQALFASNIGAADAFVKLYNKATAPTVGTDVPDMVLRVPAGGNIELKPGFNGYRFNLGLGIAITNLVADTDTTAVAAGQVKVKISRTV